MMSLNPEIESIVGRMEPNRLKALLLWFHADTQGPDACTQRLNAILEETRTLDVEACYHLMQSLHTADMVQFAMANEFGPDKAEKPAFRWLGTQVTQRLEQQVAG